MKALVLASIGVGLLSMAQPSSAHHSSAMFDMDKQIIAEGVVKNWQWTNPHSWLTVVIDDGHGNVSTRAMELGSPNTMYRRGFRADMMKPGDKVMIAYSPRKDGSSGGALKSVKINGGEWMSWLPGPTPGQNENTQPKNSTP